MILAGFFLAVATRPRYARFVPPRVRCVGRTSTSNEPRASIGELRKGFNFADEPYP